MEHCILTNMCMICKDNEVLVLDRNKEDWPGITFPGGHVMEAESFVESICREVREETGLLHTVQLCGVKQFTFDKDGLPCRYVVFLYRSDNFSGELVSSKEGEVFWIAPKDLSGYRLAEGFDEMLKVFQSDSLSECYYYQEDGHWKARLS